MSFLSLEILGGKPVELYIFQRGSDVWRYTDGRRAITVNGSSYEPAVITRGSITDSHEEAQSSVTVTLDYRLPVVAGMLTGTSSYRPLTLSILRAQDGADDTALIARGQIGSVRWTGNRVEVTFAQSAAELEQPLPRLTFLPTCNHVLGDEDCGVNLDDFTFPATVASVLAKGAVGGSPDGPAITVDTTLWDASFANAGYYTAGYFRFGLETRFLIAHTVVGSVATLVSLTDLPSGMIVGSTIDVTAGCDRRINTCDTKFDNLEDGHFGFPYMPTRNPFTQGFR